jgi:hypothetical protein
MGSRNRRILHQICANVREMSVFGLLNLHFRKLRKRNREFIADGQMCELATK